jgi:hypothetical protein
MKRKFIHQEWWIQLSIILSIVLIIALIFTWNFFTKEASENFKKYEIQQERTELLN